jgi:hypothetical protein
LEIRRQQAIEQAMERGQDIEQVTQGFAFMETMMSPLWRILIPIFMVLVAALIGAIGGAVGANLFKKGGAVVSAE